MDYYTITLTIDEYETIAEVFMDRGFEYSLKSDSQKVLDLAKKLGFEEYVKLYEGY